MGLAKRVIELNRDIQTYDSRVSNETPGKQYERVRKLIERRRLINFFNKTNKGVNDGK